MPIILGGTFSLYYNTLVNICNLLPINSMTRTITSQGAVELGAVVWFGGKENDVEGEG